MRFSLHNRYVGLLHVNNQNKIRLHPESTLSALKTNKNFTTVKT